MLSLIDRNEIRGSWYVDPAGNRAEAGILTLDPLKGGLLTTHGSGHISDTLPLVIRSLSSCICVDGILEDGRKAILCDCLPAGVEANLTYRTIRLKPQFIKIGAPRSDTKERRIRKARVRIPCIQTALQL